MPPINIKRQGVFYTAGTASGQPDRYVYYERNTTFFIVKWAIFGGLFLALIAFLVIANLHARRRVRRGLAPLGYHRWLLPASMRARFPKPGTYRQNNAAYYAPPSTYAPAHPTGGVPYVVSYVEPPPVYSNDMPPVYQPPGKRDG
ncbi:hypothetical protein EJ06DRAFT_527444 [Trichodelitschia bisporula]|uniref:Uncharacterized protein n=1 Tax=Trichodelitschia bisporula TaxID=703511 RepID=A0A6G1I6B8_9PEZI|nr:hypothetical protein EJ06DRAFT_527444 [Trichodelitschia bisporula]